MSLGAGEFPASYGGGNRIHLYGGLVYEGDSYPTPSDIAGWEERLATQASPYLKDFDAPEQRVIFHITVRPKGSPRFEVRGELIVLLGAR